MNIAIFSAGLSSVVGARVFVSMFFFFKCQEFGSMFQLPPENDWAFLNLKMIRLREISCTP